MTSMLMIGFLTTGAQLFGGKCSACHDVAAISGCAAPDMRFSGVVLSGVTFAQVVRAGILRSSGMPRFSGFSDADPSLLREYIRNPVGGGSEQFKPEGTR